MDLVTGIKKVIHTRTRSTRIHVPGGFSVPVSITIRWGFNIDDFSLRKGGIDLEKWGIDLQEDVMPTARFEFVGKSKVPESPPKCMDIAIISYWRMIVPSEQKRSWMDKLLNIVERYYVIHYM